MAISVTAGRVHGDAVATLDIASGKTEQAVNRHAGGAGRAAASDAHLRPRFDAGEAVEPRRGAM
jgi:hypothetical protein